MRSATLRLLLLVGFGVLVLWLAAAAVQGLLLFVSSAFTRFWFLSWWFQHFGLGVMVGFVLGCLACWLLLAGGEAPGERRVLRRDRAIDSGDTEAQLRALKAELDASSRRGA